MKYKYLDLDFMEQKERRRLYIDSIKCISCSFPAKKVYFIKMIISISSNEYDIVRQNIENSIREMYRSRKIWNQLLFCWQHTGCILYIL